MTHSEAVTVGASRVLPTVTAVSRTSPFAGRLMKGTLADPSYGASGAAPPRRTSERAKVYIWPASDRGARSSGTCQL